MFAPTTKPRVFALPPGVDFGHELVAGLQARLGDAEPEAMARVSLYLNTRRMQRHVRDVWDTGPPGLLPRLRLVTELGADPLPGIAPPVPPLRRRLEVMRLVTAVLDADPEIAPRAALFDLTESLLGLLDEMEVEGVPLGRLATLDGTTQSDHWQRALQFLGILEGFLEAADHPPGPGARMRLQAERLAALWQEAPPATPMLVAGSTASRGATSIFMEAVARLPQGAIILPGFDFDLPARVWNGMDDAMASEDHPQFRFKRLLDRLDLRRDDVEPWTDTAPAAPGRNRLVSLSLRPAPVTDAWQEEGPELPDLGAATRGLTLVEAPSPRAEADTIALAMRTAIADGRVAALITPDRMLTRQVAAALDRWDVRPDDSAGQPLPLSPPGRFLRQVTALATERPGAAELLALLKHPLCHAGDGRNRHLLRTRELELHLRRYGPPYPDGAALRAWGARQTRDSGREGWAGWVAAMLDRIPRQDNRPARDHFADLVALAEDLSRGPDGTDPPALWAENAGREARRICDDLGAEIDTAGTLSAQDFATLFNGLLAGGEVRDRDRGDGRALIWGTLESRVQGADLVILGGLNEGTWPEAPTPDPWLNRAMRAQAGLLLPERRIGLSAHDYQQAIAGAEVWLTRARRSDEAETVPSRWLNRLTNLLDGLGETGGPDALAAMRERGDDWIARAAALTAPRVAPVPAIRPSPRPPVPARPRRISVTQIQKLIRDPYAIYAAKVLRLNALDPLVAAPDAPLRGTILHDALEAFGRADVDPADPAARDRFLAETERALATACPWPAHRRLWAARMARVVDWFLTGERARRLRGTPFDFEVEARLEVPEIGVTLTGKADRIDLTEDGAAVLYDYKTGNPPTVDQQKTFDKQLLLEAAMTSRGAFADLGNRETVAAEFIALGTDPRVVAAPLDEHPAEQTWAEFIELMRAWSDPSRGYSARAHPFTDRERSDYDHLARRGEWDGSTDFTPEDLE